MATTPATSRDRIWGVACADGCNCRRGNRTRPAEACEALGVVTGIGGESDAADERAEKEDDALSDVREDEADDVDAADNVCCLD